MEGLLPYKSVTLDDLYEVLHRAGGSIRNPTHWMGPKYDACSAYIRSSGPCGLDPDPVQVR